MHNENQNILKNHHETELFQVQQQRDLSRKYFCAADIK